MRKLSDGLYGDFMVEFNLSTNRTQKMTKIFDSLFCSMNGSTEDRRDNVGSDRRCDL